MLELSTPIAIAARKASNWLLERIGNEELVAPHYSADGGLGSYAGSALAFAMLGRARAHTGDLETANRLLAAATRIEWKRAGLYDGLSGTLLVASHARREPEEYGGLCRSILRNLHADYSELCGGTDYLQPSRWTQYDLITGWAGTLIAVSSCGDESLSEMIAGYLLWLFEKPERWALDGIITAAPVHRVLNLSLSHGLAGVVAAFVIARRAHSEIEYLAELLVDYCSEGSGRTWCGARILGGERIVEAGMTWCYGIAGISAALCMAGIVLQREDLCERAIRAFEMTRELYRPNSLPDSALCHGRMGLALVSAMLGRCANEEAYDALARALVEEILADFNPELNFGFYCSSKFASTDAPCLLSGGGGIALGLLTLLGDVPATWMNALGILPDLFTVSVA